MDLFLEVMTGEALGKRFKLTNGLKIGRRGCDINLADRKISSHHADIVSRKGQIFFIQDHESSNGIKVNGRKVRELLLAHGVEFRLGNTLLKVIDPNPVVEKPKNIKKEALIILEPMPKIPVPPPSHFLSIEKAGEKITEKITDRNSEKIVEPAGLKNAAKHKVELPARLELEMPETWRDVLLNLIHNAGLRAQDVVNDEICAFNPPLKLTCSRGQEYGNSWIFGYGPRSVGTKSPDLTLTEPEAPEICFEVRPHLSGAEFSTQFPKIVKLNSQECARDILQKGDVIEILNTHLTVDFNEK